MPRLKNRCALNADGTHGSIELLNEPLSADEPLMAEYAWRHSVMPSLILDLRIGPVRRQDLP